MHRVRQFGICALATLALTVTVSAQQSPAAPPATPRSRLMRASVPKVLPGTRESAFTTIQGNALDSANFPLPESDVRLRDARYGRIVDSQLTDNSGLFSFKAIDPGTYVVELLGADRSVLAASQLLSLSAGEVASTVVKLPYKIQSYASLLGHSVQQAAVITSAAAASGVLATKVTGVDASSR